LSDAAAFSFYPTKNLGALGDGGAVVVHVRDQAERVRWLRNYGQNPDGICVLDGMNSRLDETQAAVLRVLLPICRQIMSSGECTRAVMTSHSGHL
jgi:dTDP-4-amino-4,6-dideoxygalactose transaminase